MNTSAKILLVGHCGPDSWLLKGVVERAAPGAKVVRVNDQKAMERELAGAALALVNRVLDGEFAAESGIDLIAAAGPERAGRMMLVSNFADAQERAIAAGALPGFGKSDAGKERTAGMILSAITGRRSAAPREGTAPDHPGAPGPQAET